VDKPRRIPVNKATGSVRRRTLRAAALVALSVRIPTLTALLIASLAACTANRPKIVVDENGPQYPNGTGSFAIFQQHYQYLYTLQSSANPDPAQIRASANALVREGSSLAYQLCGSFFKTAGTEQQYLLFGRDVIGVAGTLATGILGATNAGSAAIGAVGIGSGAALSAISIYARNFLFSEDNVQAVQNLTLNAMSAATATALERTDYDFFTAVQAIMDIQSVCEVQSILALVRQSINQAKPQVVSVNNNRIAVEVPPQQAIQIRQSGLNPAAAAEWLRLQDPAAIRKAANGLDNFSTYSDAAQFPLAGPVAASIWVIRNDSDPRHLADVARRLGWSGQ